MENRKKGAFWVLVCVALWALIPVVSKSGQSDLDNHQFLFWSSLVSFIVLIGTSAYKGNLKDLRKMSLREVFGLAGLGLLGTYIYYLFLYLGYARADGLEVLVVQYTWPFLIVILSVFILKEKLTVKKFSAVILGFAGVMIVLTKGKFGDVRFSNVNVILLVLLGAFSFALFSVLSKKVERNPLISTSIYFLAATIASFCSMLFFSDFRIPGGSVILPVLVNGVFVNGFSYVFWMFALRSASASYLAPFTYLTPVLSAVYLVLFFQEPFIPAYAAGLFLVLAGGLINSKS